MNRHDHTKHTKLILGLLDPETHQVTAVTKEDEESILVEWAAKFGTSNRTVQQDHLNGYFISTVFIGVDMNHALNGDPLWFETMVFLEDTHPTHPGEPRFMRRYTTWNEALIGHLQQLEIIRHGNF